MESPGKSLSIAVVSSTQMALDHPTPFFVPSCDCEQAQDPINATPENVSETEKVNWCCSFRYFVIYVLLFCFLLNSNSRKEDDGVQM